MGTISESFHYVKSDYTTNFRNVLPGPSGSFALGNPAVPAVGVASQYANLQIVPGLAQGTCKSYITSVKLLSLQNLDWRVEFHSRRVSEASAVYSSNNLVGYVGWTNNAATAYATSFLYYTHGLKIPYLDEDGLGELHVNLLNNTQATNNATKFAGDSGAVHLTVGLVMAS